jgi:tetratricopeptide (TPR) repeat protein
METLKKIMTSSILLFAVLIAGAQSESKWQVAFNESYTQEANKQYSAAINSLKAVYDEKSYELNLRLGWLTYLNKEYTTSQSYYQKTTDKTLQVYEDILKIDPQQTKANYWAGVIWYNRKKYETAARYFEKLINLYPFDFDGNHMLAWTYLNMGRSNDAKLLFGKALLAKPGDASCLEGLKQVR